MVETVLIWLEDTCVDVILDGQAQTVKQVKLLSNLIINSLTLTKMKKKPFENTVGKGENAGN